MRGRAILSSGIGVTRGARRAVCAMVALVLALVCASSIAGAQTPGDVDAPPASTHAAGAYFRGAGDDQDSWFALPAGRLGWTLHHVPAEAPAGTVRRVGLMSQRPALMASGDARLVMVFEPAAATAERARGPWVVRELRVTRLRVARGAEPLTTYTEPAPLMPLPADVTPMSLAFDGGVLHALCAVNDADGRARLLAFWRGAWSERGLPVESVRASDLSLMSISRRLALVQRASGGAASGTSGGAAEDAVLWLLKPGVSAQATGEQASEEPAWDRGALGAFDGLMPAGGQVLRVEATQADGWRVSLVRAGGVVPIAEVGAVSPRVDAPEGAPWIVPVGDGVGMFWGDEEWSKRRDQPRAQRGVGEAPSGAEGAAASAAEAAPVPMYATRVYARVIGASGQVLHDGPAKLATPVGSGEFEALGLALLSLVAAVSAFVFRRDRERDGVVRLPEGASLASGNRRIAATMIDAAVATLIAAWAWSVPVLDVLLITGVGVSEAGLKPTASALAVLFVTSAACEALCGRTLGKLVVGTRTISASTGRNPGWGQAIGRSAVKAFCPPLAAFYVSPAQPDQAGLFGTLVISGPPRPNAEQN